MPNIWSPDGVLPGFKETCMDFYWVYVFCLHLIERRANMELLQACHEVLELNFLRALALGLGVPEDYFLQFHTKADNQLRLLHYPRYAFHMQN